MKLEKEESQQISLFIMSLLWWLHAESKFCSSSCKGLERRGHSKRLGTRGERKQGVCIHMEARWIIGGEMMVVCGFFYHYQDCILIILPQYQHQILVGSVGLCYRYFGGSRYLDGKIDK